MGAGKMLEDLAVVIVTTAGFTIIGAASGIALTVNTVTNPDKSIVEKVGLSVIQTVGLTGVGAFVGLVTSSIIVAPTVTPTTAKKRRRRPVFDVCA